jgi:ferrous iron transport protein A
MATAAYSRVIPLGRMSSGERATLVDVVGQPEQVRRMQELGFRCGMSLEMIRAGSPCIVRLCGQTMCIRGNEFLNVLVECED